MHPRCCAAVAVRFACELRVGCAPYPIAPYPIAPYPTAHYPTAPYPTVTDPTQTLPSTEGRSLTKPVIRYCGVLSMHTREKSPR